MPRTITLTREKLAELVAKRDEAVAAYPMLAPAQAFSSACGPYLPLLIDCATYLMRGATEGDTIEWVGPLYATERRDALLHPDATCPPEIANLAGEYCDKFGVTFEEAILHYAHIVEGCPANMAAGADPISLGGVNNAHARIHWLRDRKDPQRPRPGDLFCALQHGEEPEYRRVIDVDLYRVRYAPGTNDTRNAAVEYGRSYEEFQAWAATASLIERDGRAVLFIPDVAAIDAPAEAVENG